MLLPASQAEAQGLFDLLFGKPKPEPMAVPPPQQRGALPQSAAPRSLSRQQEGEDASEPRSSTYKTVCVRMCDGAFTPLSFSTTKSNFGQDQAKCSASCGSEARLFYFRNPGAGMEDAVDLSGRAYNRLPNAFKFRKAIVEGCACRPPPWSEAAQARHRSYAAAEQVAPTNSAQTATAPTVRVAQASDAKPSTKPTSQSVPPTVKTGIRQGDLHAAVSDAADAPADGAAQAKSNKQRAPSRSATDISKSAKVVGAGLPPKPVSIAAASVAKPVGGVFGLGGGAGTGMGLSGQPKYRWPGD